MADLLPVHLFTKKRLKSSKYNIAKLQSLCDRENIPWADQPKKGRKDTYINLLLAHKATMAANNNNNDSNNNQPPPPPPPAPVNHQSILDEFIRANGLPPISDIDANNNNNNNNNNDTYPPNLHSQNNNNNHNNNASIANLPINVPIADDAKNNNQPPNNNNQQQKSAELQEFERFLSLNGLTIYKDVLIENGYDAIDVIVASKLEELTDLISKKGHIRKLLTRASKHTHQMGGGDDAVAQGLAAGISMCIRCGSPMNTSQIIIALQIEHDGRLISRALFGVATNTGELRADLEKCRAARHLEPITRKIDPISKKKINGGHKCAKGIALLLHRWQLLKLTDVFDPNAAMLEPSSQGRGGPRWFGAKISERRSISQAHDLLSSDDEKANFKKEMILKYRKWVDWKRLGVRKGDRDRVMILYGDILQ